MALDEPADDDKVQEIDGISFVVDNDLYELYKGFTIESVKQGAQTGFRIIPDVQTESKSGCSSCSSCD